jgi:hypothetical protein
MPTSMRAQRLARRENLLRRRRQILSETAALDERQILNRAEQIADSVTIEAALFDFLYRRSRWQPMQRSEWERCVKVACAIDRLLTTEFRRLPRGKLANLFDDKSKRDFEAFLSAKGRLLLTFHGAFVLVARRLFIDIDKQRSDFGRGGNINSRRDHRGALFSALRALQDGQSLVISPDGPDGKLSGVLNVLGTQSPAGEGAAFLAAASGCKTAWYTVGREGDRFVPVFAEGPTRTKDETPQQFGDRLHRFYSEKIEEMFTGDPRNIVLRRRWSRLFH